MVKAGGWGAGWRGANGGEIEDICNSVKTEKNSSKIQRTDWLLPEAAGGE